MAAFVARANTSVKPKETQAFQAPLSFQTNDAKVGCHLGRDSNDCAASSSMGAIKSQATKNNLKTHPQAQLSSNRKPSSKLKVRYRLQMVITLGHPDIHSQMSANSIDDTVLAQIVPNVMNENVGPPKEWPADTDIVFHPSVKVASVSLQTPTIHRLITEATTHQIPIVLCWDYTFPAAGSVQYQVMRQVFVKAANELKLDAIKKRLELDSEYANFLAQSGRISNFRGALKEKATLIMPHSYRIKNLKHTEQVALVNSLLTKDNYIYAYERGRFIEEKPYCNDGITDIIHEAFFGTKPITRFRLVLFSSSITEGPGSEEKELPASMVALATTTAFASLQELQNSFYNQIHFDSGTYAGYYLDHLATLNEIKRQNPNLYHKLMAYLFRVTSQSLPDEPMDPTGTLTEMANPHVKATIIRMGDQLGAWADPVA
ncbi:hypothetical protein HETIRDRAFT_422700 [Heterobasidion irregulare TC 32-1]|uniref:DUF6532 domain-containing protein n=1 Tax=Heterobasidion irregulare (strain TC 32-1) TaxID=747525 RepID=W4JRL9_HETIT|nr:uncharacterized protein HETIRDRAFT_422700 [Heterobasidion irregulare TC 32-1]ETW76109.1 hypothetical protein HETIRDRAFT_422700 [Heterobasidion irregulare TC 32-1]